MTKETASIFTSAWSDISQLHSIEKWLMIFWLSGPFLFLIERSVADFWISTLGIAFLGRCAIKRDWSWMSLFWPKAVLAFWVTMFLSAVTSALPQIAIVESAIWIRFPLLVAATVFWIAQTPSIVRLMLIFVGVGLAILSIILCVEIYTTFEQWAGAGGMSSRLTWPYGDPVPGNYFGKFGLVAALWIACAVSSQNMIKIYFGIVAGIGMVMFVVLTGERVNSLLVICTIFLGIILLNYNRKKFLFVALSSVFAIVFFAITRTEFLLYKFTTSLILGVTSPSSGYLHIWKTGIEIFWQDPLTGIGTSLFRYLCAPISVNFNFVARCDNHPHQYYVQALAETGVIGTTTFIIMVAAICYATYRNGHRASGLLGRILWVVPFALFFPLQAHADLFGQWVNAMTWSSIALAMGLSATTHSK